MAVEKRSLVEVMKIFGRVVDSFCIPRVRYPLLFSHRSMKESNMVAITGKLEVEEVQRGTYTSRRRRRSFDPSQDALLVALPCVYVVVLLGCSS